MSRPSASADNSLAFVDVITNGLGGMLVLFFIMLMVQSSLEWNSDSSGAAKSHISEYPFVVIVKPKDAASCFDTARSVWQTDGLPAGMIDTTRGKNLDWGGDYALFVAPSPLSPTKSSLSVRTNRSTELDVEIYPAGAKPRRYVVQSVQGGLVEVWPRLGDARK
jgi:hypothetical protein